MFKKVMNYDKTDMMALMFPFCRSVCFLCGRIEIPLVLRPDGLGIKKKG